MLLLPAVLAAGLLLLASRHGEDTGPDSAAYLGTAHSLAAGRGFEVPIHFYPLGSVDIGVPPAGSAAPRTTPLVVYSPLEPVLLAPGGHPVGTARVENMVLFALSVLIAGLLVMRLSGSLWMAVAAQLVIGFQRVPELLVGVQTTSASLFLALLAIASVLRYRSQPARRWLVLATVALGLGVLERYAAGGVVVWAVIALWYRRRTAITVGALSLLPVIGWFLYEDVTGASTGHSLRLHVATTTMRSGTRSVADWVLPANFGSGVAALAALAVVGVLAAAAWRGGRREARLVLLFALVQVVFLVMAATIVDAGVSLEPREMVTVFALCAVALAVAVRPGGAAKALAALAAAAAVVSSGIAVAHNQGRTYSAPAWTRSALMADVRSLPPNTVIFSNAPDAIYLLTGRATASIPETQDYSTLKVNTRFSTQMREMATTLRERHGVLVYVRYLPGGTPRDPSSPRDAFLPSEGALTNQLALTDIKNETGGAIYRIG